MRYSTETRFRKYVKGYGFLSFARKFGDTLREIIFAGINFRGFRGFLPNRRKLIPAKNLFCPKPRKLVPAKLVKNFDPQK